MKTIKARHKLVPAIIMLIVAAITMSTASYAWFTMSNRVEVTGINLSVVAPTNLLIREKGIGNFTNSITVAANPSGKLSHASSEKGEVMFTVENPIANVKPDGTLKADTNIVTTTTPVASTDGYYVDFEFELINTGSTVATIGLNNLQINVGTTSVAGGDVVDAVRFAILEGGTTSRGVFGMVPENLTVYGAAGTAIAAGSQTVISSTATSMFTVLANGVISPLANQKDITVRIWIEGQDPDCVSLNAGSSFNISFDLVVLP